MFKKQDRFESLEKFNPSPDAYDSYTSFVKMPKSIKTGSLKGPSESNKTLGSFGGVRRFTIDKNSNPGPGSYATTKQKQQMQQYESINTKKRAKSLANFQSRMNMDHNQIQMYMGNPPQQIYSEYQILQNNEEEIKPGYSFPRSRYKQRELAVKEVQPQAIYKPALKQKQYESLIKIKQENRKRKLQLIEMMLKKQIPKPNALSLQYKRRNQQKPLPGPGTYTIRTKPDLTESSAFKSKIEKSPLQPSKHISELVGPGTYTIKQLDKTPSYCFNREQRKTSLIENKDLPYQFYNKDVASKKSFIKPNADYQAPFGSGTNRFAIPVTPQIVEPVYKIKSKSRKSTRYQDSETSQDNTKPLQSIQILTDFYRNK